MDFWVIDPTPGEDPTLHPRRGAVDSKKMRFFSRAKLRPYDFVFRLDS